MIIVGMTACGKTHYLLEMLEKEYKNHFDYIFIVCPTFKYNKTYQNWKYLNDPDVFALNCRQDDVNNTLEDIIGLAEIEKEEGNEMNSLIILDDCAASKDIKNRTSELVNLGFSGRHIGISTIVITQQLTSISKPYREQLSKIVAFDTVDAEGEQVLFKKYMKKFKITKEEEEEIQKKLGTIRYTRLEIKLQVPKYYKIITP